MSRHLIIILLAIVSIFLGTNGFTQEKEEPGPARRHSGRNGGRSANQRLYGGKNHRLQGDELKRGDVGKD